MATCTRHPIESLDYDTERPHYLICRGCGVALALPAVLKAIQDHRAHNGPRFTGEDLRARADEILGSMEPYPGVFGVDDQGDLDAWQRTLNIARFVVAWASRPKEG